MISIQSKTYILHIPVNERDIERFVIKKTNQFISLHFADIQLVDSLNFVGGATSFDSFLKPYRISESKRFFKHQWFDQPDKLQKTQLSPYDATYSKLRSCNSLETDCTDYVNLSKNGMATE